MKEYDKEKLNEYAKELFALCLEKGVKISVCAKNELVVETECENGFYVSNISFMYFDKTIDKHIIPIWELIEKVKQL